jgi:hypothetical protein
MWSLKQAPQNDKRDRQYRYQAPTTMGLIYKVMAILRLNDLNFSKTKTNTSQFFFISFLFPILKYRYRYATKEKRGTKPTTDQLKVIPFSTFQKDSNKPRKMLGYGIVRYRTTIR